MKTLLFILLSFCSTLGFSQTQKLTIYFDGLTTNDGKIMVLVQDKDEKDISKLVVNISNKSSKVSVYLPFGFYGVIAFHDINGNEKLDTNFIGVPTEPYGFSNNARGFLSKPNFKETLVNLNGEVDITFNLK